MAVFKTAALDHSASLPYRTLSYIVNSWYFSLTCENVQLYGAL